MPGQAMLEPLDSVETKFMDVSQTRQKNLITIGVKSAVDLREVARARGIPKADD